MKVMERIIALEGLGLVKNFLRIFGSGIRRLAYGVVGEELYGRSIVEELITDLCVRLDRLALTNLPRRRECFFGIMPTVLELRMTKLNEMFPNAYHVTFLSWNEFANNSEFHKHFVNIRYLKICDETHLPLSEIVEIK